MTTLNAQIVNRHDTAANWTSENPILFAGEFGLEDDTNKGKKGDGITAWNDLLYFGGGGGGGSIDSVTGDGVDNTDPANPVISYPTPADIGAELAGAAATAQENAESYADGVSSNSSVIAKVLTGFAAGAGTVSAADSILSAFQKIVGNIAAIVQPPTTTASNDVQMGDGSGHWIKKTITEFTTLIAGYSSWLPAATLQLYDDTARNVYDAKHGFAPKAIIATTGNANFLGTNVDTVAVSPTWMPLFDSVNPADNGTAAPGMQIIAARRDHVHSGGAAPQILYKASASLPNVTPSAPGTITVFDVPIPANLLVDGHGIRAKVEFQQKTNTSARNNTFQLTYGTTVIVTSGAVAHGASANRYFDLILDVIPTGANAQQGNIASIFYSPTTGTSGTRYKYIGTGAEDTSTIKNLKFEIIVSGAVSSMVLWDVCIEKI